MEKQKEEIIAKKDTKETILKEIPDADNNLLSMNQLIEKISILSQNHKPYTVSKEIEEIKSIFYIKLNLEKEQVEEVEITTKETKKENIKTTLHPLELKFKSTFDHYRKIKSNFRKNKEEEEEENLRKKKQIIKDIDTLVKEEESLKITFDRFRTLQVKWKNTGHVPITENNHLWQSYHHHVELFYDFIKLNNDLRDLDFKRNLQEKNAIFKKASALLEEKSINKAHEKLQELHEHWKNVGPVERRQRETIWEEFQEISRKINKKRNDYFLEKKTKDSKKLAEKNAICSEIDNLISKKYTSHNQWQTASDKCNELESKWKSLSGISSNKNKIAWKKLRDSLNNFYNTKNNFYKQKKGDLNKALKNKLAICEKSESLKDSTDWLRTGKELIKLQVEWKNSEFAPASQSNQIWKRFRTSCDTFFKNRKAHFKKIEKEEDIAYKLKEEIIKEIEKFKVSSEIKNDINRLKEFSSKWNSIGHIPREKIDINTTFFNILNSKFEELGLSKKMLAAEQFKNKINSIKGNQKAISNEQEFLSQKISILKREIAQYENNISFFGSGKNTKPLLENAQNKIDGYTTEIQELKEKIQLLNNA